MQFRLWYELIQGNFHIKGTCYDSGACDIFSNMCFIDNSCWLEDQTDPSDTVLFYN